MSKIAEHKYEFDIDENLFKIDNNSLLLVKDFHSDKTSEILELVFKLQNLSGYVEMFARKNEDNNNCEVVFLLDGKFKYHINGGLNINYRGEGPNTFAKLLSQVIYKHKNASVQMLNLLQNKQVYLKF